MNEEISQDWDNTSSDSTPAVAATLAAVMSFVHTKGIDEQGEAGDVVEEDVGRNGNEDDENENEEQGRVGDVANQSHTATPHDRMAKWPPCKQKAQSNLDWHLAAFMYRSLVDGDHQRRCRHEVLNELYGNNQISQYLYLQILPTDNPIFVECESYCCVQCGSHPIQSCCNLCDPEHTTSMYIIDIAPRTKCKPNRVKVDPD